MSFLEVDNKGDGENNLMYVKHDNRAGKGFFNGETDVSDVNFVADFENCKIGWGKFENGDYYKEWQDNIATRSCPKDQLIANGYKRAFSLYLFSNDAGLKLWERDSAMEWNGFLDVAKAYEREKDPRVRVFLCFAGRRPGASPFAGDRVSTNEMRLPHRARCGLGGA